MSWKGLWEGEAVKKVIVRKAALAIHGTPVLTGEVGVAYSGFTVSASGGTAPYNFSVHAGGLPDGITLDSGSGVVSGTPTIDGSFADIVIRVTDQIGHTADLASFTLAVSPAVAVGGFNGGRSQVNFKFLQTGGDYPFLNCLKTAQSWAFVDNSGVPPPSSLNSDGYPTAITNGGVYTVFFVPTSAERPGNYVLKWQGTGTVAILGATGSPFSGIDARFIFANPNPRVVLQIKAGINLSNLAFCHADDEALLDAGEVFGTRFKDVLAEGNFGVLRFLNWQINNTTNVRYWADRKPVNYAFYHGSEMRSNIYGGATTNSGDDYSVGAPPGWGGLVDKAIVTVKFNASAAGTAPTLNVAGTGAKTIKRPHGNGPLVSTEKPLIGKYGTLVYDADLDCWLKQGGDTALGNVYLNNGVPPELMLRLCAEMGAHPWFCPPFLACDPITDWITELAIYCRDNAPSWMVPRFEAAPNESWNSASGFYATRYGWAKAFAHWGALAGSFDINDWVGKVASLQGQAVSEVYLNDRTKYQSIVGVQTMSSPKDVRLTSALYVSQNAGSAAYNWATHVCCVTYYRDTYTDAQRGTAAINYDAADTAGKLVIATDFVNSCTSNTPADAQHQFSLPNLAVRYATFKAWAAGFSVNGLVAYEGGWSPDYVTAPLGGATADQINTLYRASKDVAALATHTTTNYDNFTAAGGAFPSCFQLAGASNVWSVFDPDIYATPGPQWDAIVSFNS